jgi:hypothetical protein
MANYAEKSKLTTLIRLFDFDPCRLARQVSEFGKLN